MADQFHMGFFVSLQSHLSKLHKKTILGSCRIQNSRQIVMLSLFLFSSICYTYCFQQLPPVSVYIILQLFISIKTDKDLSFCKVLFKKMLAVFNKSVANPPKELSLPFSGRNCANSSTEEIAEVFRSWRSNSTSYNLPNGNFLALSHEDENPIFPRSIVVIDDIFCMFSGTLYNTCDLIKHYGLSRQATDPMIIVEAYKVLRDRAPYPPDQVVKGLEGKFAFVLFDSKASIIFLAADRDGSVQLHWGTAVDGSLVCTDDPNCITAACGKCYMPFPPGCMFTSESGLTSYDHPMHKVRGIPREDDDGNISAVIFQVDLFTRLHSIPRKGSAANWSGITTVEHGD